MKQLELNKGNINAYLVKTANLCNLGIIKILSIIEIVEYSNANYLFKVRINTKKGNEILIIKQARSYTKRSQKQKIKFFVNARRINGEVKMIKLLQQIWGQKYVPEIFYFDKKNSILIMSDIGQGRRLLIEDFKLENIHPEAGIIFGKFFGVLHGQTYKTKQDIISSEKWKKWVTKIVIKDNWAKAMKKYVSREKVEKFLTQADRAEKSIIWLDPVHRNIFIKNRSVAFFDFDLSMRNDPAIDIGIFLSHWVWMMLKEDSRLNKDSQKFIKNFISGYEKTFKANLNKNKEELQKILKRSIGWLALYLISRTDGKSGSYFKHNALWEEKIRNTAIDLFIDNKENINVKIINNLILRQYE